MEDNIKRFVQDNKNFLRSNNELAQQINGLLNALSHNSNIDPKNIAPHSQYSKQNAMQNSPNTRLQDANCNQVSKTIEPVR